MNEVVIFRVLLYVFFALALLTVPALFFITAPYGRHAKDRGWGPRIRSRTGWILMEAPSPILMALCFAIGKNNGIAEVVFLLLWQVHYLNRAFIFPFRMRGGDRPMPLFIAGSAVIFNLFNGYLNGRWLFTLGPPHPSAWLLEPRFLIGAALFAVGLVINLQSDQILMNLRRPGETGYKIPRGGLYRLVSCPNYLGEIIEWTGWAIATWSLPGLAFALWTTANLLPRARSNHLFYKERFPDYPKERRALIPFLY